MRTRKLGLHGPELSVVGFGAWEMGGQFYGPNPDEEVMFEAIRAGVEQGMNWVDTAERYGNGLSESLVGRALAGIPQKVFVATKLAPSPEGSGFDPDGVRRGAEASLERLGTGRIDLYQLHWFPEDPDFAIERTWEAMAGLVEEGLADHIGVSNFSKAQIEKCMAVRHVDSLQPQLSIFHRKNEELAAWCGGAGVGVVAYGALAYGLLTGRITPQTRFDPGDFRSGSDPGMSYYRELFAPGKIEKKYATVQRLAAVAERIGTGMGQLALAWALHRPGVTSAIAGSRSPVHTRENAAAGDVVLDDETLEEIAGILTSES